MYAVIRSGGKQYRVKEGQTLKLATIPAEVGEKIDFDEVLLLADGDNIKLGKPYIDGCKIAATIVSHGRGKKIRIVKFRRRKHHMKSMGHRQNFTEVKIEKIA
jgi:large subunit ribosomal protein L21